MPQDVGVGTPILPNGACRPLLDTPCGWRNFGIEPRAPVGETALSPRLAPPPSPERGGSFRAPPASLPPIEGKGEPSCSPLTRPMTNPARFGYAPTSSRLD